MTALDVRTATQTIFNALRDTLSLAFERRYPEALDIAALKAVDASTIPDRGLLFVRSEGVVYRWSMASTQPEVVWASTVSTSSVRTIRARGRRLRCMPPDRPDPGPT